MKHHKIVTPFLSKGYEAFGVSMRIKSGGRKKARCLAFQGLYAWLVNQEEPQKIAEEVLERALLEEKEPWDMPYFQQLLIQIPARQETLRTLMQPFLRGRTIEEIDPVEQAILLLSLHELSQELAIPYRVVINEALELVKAYGSAEGYKFINSILDRAAQELRPVEVAQFKARPKN